MRFTLKFKLFITVACLFLILITLAVNQYLEARTMEAQTKFDMAVMQRDQQEAMGIEKITTEIQKLIITPTVLPIRHITPIPTK